MQENEKKQIGTTDDLSKDMIFEGDEYKNKEGVSQSTATEGDLNKPKSENDSERKDIFKGNEEDAKDNNIGNTDAQTTNSDPTYIPTLEEDEKMEKKHG